MNIEPSFKTAALAGAWFAVGGIPVELWTDGNHGLTTLQSNLLMLGFGVFFFFLPCYFLVLGRHEPFEIDWIMEPSERARYAVIVKRMLVWMFSASAALMLWAGLSALSAMLRR